MITTEAIDVEMSKKGDGTSPDELVQEYQRVDGQRARLFIKAFAYLLFVALQIYILFAAPNVSVWFSPFGGLILLFFVYHLLFIEKKCVTTFSRRTNGITAVFHKSCICTVTKRRLLSDLVNVYFVEDVRVGAS